MSNDLATEITRRVKGLLDGLLSTLVWRWLPALPPLGQKLCARYSDWLDRLFSRLYLPITSALLPGQSSKLWLLPLSYAWFDTRWINRRKRSRSFRRQSRNKRDEDIQRPLFSRYFFEEDTEEDAVKQFQFAQSDPADDIMFSVPTLMILSARNTKFTQAEQLAKKIALKLEMLTNKGSPPSWQTPFEASGVLYFPKLAANNSLLLGKFKEIITSQHLSHLEETLAVSPFILSSEGMNLDFEPSEALPIALIRQPASEARIAFPSHSGMFKPPQVASDDISAGNTDTTPISCPEKIPLFHRDETLDMTSVASRYFERLAPQPPLDNNWESRQIPPSHWSAGHIPPSPTQEAASQEMGEPVKAIASTIKNNSFGGYNRSVEVELALAPIGRRRENIPAATSSAESTGREGVLETAGETMPALDTEALASEVYSILKRRLIVEKERTTSVV